MRASAAVSMFFVSAALVACSACKNDDAPAPPASAAPASQLGIGQGKRTTSPGIAVSNLQGRIRQGERMVEKGADINVRSALVWSLLDRATYLGKVSDLERIGALEEEIGKDAAADGDAILARASAASAIHKFDRALELLADAEKKHAEKTIVRSKRAAILLAQGKYEEACPVFAELANGPKNHGHLMMQAVCVAQLGRIEEADRLFADAEAAYKDVSPFVLASIWFERGSMWERAGDESKATTLYRAAIERLPQHAHAAAHLAQMVPPEEAEAILKPVMEVSDDPEQKAILGLAKEKIAAGSGKALLDEAKQGYDALLAKYPLAFADHAGWFYLKGVKDPARAAEVARENLKNRKTHEAYELAIVALTAAGSTTEACDAADEALKRAWVPAGLKAAAEKAYEACGRKK